MFPAPRNLKIVRPILMRSPSRRTYSSIGSSWGDEKEAEAQRSRMITRVLGGREISRYGELSNKMSSLRFKPSVVEAREAASRRFMTNTRKSKAA